MFLQDFSEPGKIQILIILQQNEEEIELGERQLELLQFTRRHWLLVKDMIAITCLATLAVLGNRQDLAQLVVKRSESTCGLR